MENITCKNCNSIAVKRKGTEFCSKSCKNEYWNGKRSKETDNTPNESFKTDLGNVSSPIEAENVPPEKVRQSTSVITFDYAQCGFELGLLKRKRYDTIVRLDKTTKQLSESGKDMRFSAMVAGAIVGSPKGLLGASLGILSGAILNKVIKKSVPAYQQSLFKEINELNWLLFDINSSIDKVEKKQKAFPKYQEIESLVDNPEYVAYVNRRRQEKELEVQQKEKERREHDARASLAEEERQNRIAELENGGKGLEVPIPSKKRIVSSKELSSMKFTTLDFQGKWKDFLGEPAVNFYMLIYGRPGSGKSTFTIQLALYLALKFGKVLYISGEEGFSKTLQHKLMNHKAINDNLDLADFHSQDEILEVVPQDVYDFIIIDSLNNMKIDAEGLRTLMQRYSGSALIAIAQSTKDGKMRGSNEIIHDCDIEIVVADGIATTLKNRYLIKDKVFKVFKDDVIP
jgi:hypothetical protein